MSKPIQELKEGMDLILKQTADLLLTIGCTSDYPVSDSALNIKPLNTSIKTYQDTLDKLELQVIHAIGNQKAAYNQAQSESMKPQEPSSIVSQPKQETPAHTDTAFSSLDDFDYYKMNNDNDLDMFANPVDLSGSGMLDDQYF